MNTKKRGIVICGGEPENGRKKQRTSEGPKKDFKSINLETDKEWIEEKHTYNNKQNVQRHACFPMWYIAYGKSVGLEYGFANGDIKVTFRQYTFGNDATLASSEKQKMFSTVKLTLDEWEALRSDLSKLAKVIAAAEGQKKKKTPEEVLGIDALTPNNKGWKKHQYALINDVQISIDWNAKSALIRLKRDDDSVLLSACGFSYFEHFLLDRIEKAIEMWKNVKESCNWEFAFLN